MGKRIDITDKLNFEEKPVIVIKGTEIEVNDDAANVIRIMGMVDDGDPSPAALSEMATMIFTEEGNKALSSLRLNMTDLATVIEVAMDLITGDDEAGELVNGTMTLLETGI